MLTHSFRIASVLTLLTASCPLHAMFFLEGGGNADVNDQMGGGAPSLPVAVSSVKNLPVSSSSAASSVSNLPVSSSSFSLPVAVSSVKNLPASPFSAASSVQKLPATSSSAASSVSNLPVSSSSFSLSVVASSPPSLPATSSSAASLSVVASSSSAVPSRAGVVTPAIPEILLNGAGQQVVAIRLAGQMNSSGVQAVSPEGEADLPVYQGGQLAVGADNNDNDQPHPPGLPCALEDRYHEQALLDLVVRDTIPPDVRIVMSASEALELQSRITAQVLYFVGRPVGGRSFGLCDLVTGSIIQMCFMDPKLYAEAQRRIQDSRTACKAGAPQPLDLSNLGLSFLPGKFGKLKGLTDLNLARNPTLISFERLGLLTSLTRLNLFQTGLSSLTPLKPLINLKELGLGGNFLVSLEGIEGLVSLELLDVSSNKVQKLDPLRALKALRILSVEGNPIDSVNALKELSLTTLSVSARDEMAPFQEDLEALLAKGCNVIYKGEDGNHLLRSVANDLKSFGNEVKTWVNSLNSSLNRWWNQT